ncbi:MAG: response regulator [Spartobacteria bacterium]|nr:response regulator [Spartobacteria bacterium]
MPNGVHTVLVVDDEESILQLIERQLINLPFIIIPTSSPAEAIHILQTREISVLLCDLNMPYIDGNMVLSAAKEANPNIISLVMTGAADQTATIRAINEGGIWKFVIKPWKGAELAELVGEAVRRYAVFSRQQTQLEALAKELPVDDEEPITNEIEEMIQTEVEQEKPLRKLSEQERENLLGRRYELGSVLGEGGTGTVYKAHDQLLNMPVAIKMLGSRFTIDTPAINALKHEARIAMQLSHRHIVRIHNLQTEKGRFFLVMEYVNGQTFDEILKRYRKLPLDTVLQTVRICAEALGYAHRHHVLHKDLKPANLMLDERGVLKIIDFGVACLMEGQPEADFVLGTPIYMSPEQLTGQNLDNRTDVYSLGLIAYELLTGNKAFHPDTSVEDIVLGPQNLKGLHKDILNILAKAVYPDRDDRWDTAEEFSRALTDTCNRIF